MFPRGYYGGGYFGPEYWPGGVVFSGGGGGLIGGVLFTGDGSYVRPPVRAKRKRKEWTEEEPQESPELVALRRQIEEEDELLLAGVL